MKLSSSAARSWLSALAAIALALPLVGCAVGAPEIDSENAEDDSDAVQTTRRLLLCQQGLSDRTMEWDKGLFSLCETVEKAGFELVRDGAYPAFGAMDENGAYRAMFDALDTNNDGWVDGSDTPTELHLVGFSWGGINVTDLANRLRKDSRVATGRRGVAGMVLLDPFQPQRWRAPIPANVARAWEYRQTDTTEDDCSSTVSLGFGFNGLSPKAKSASSACSVYDLDTFMDGVGHCDVPVRARDAAIVNLTQHKDYAAWSAYAEECPLD